MASDPGAKTRAQPPSGPGLVPALGAALIGLGVASLVIALAGSGFGGDGVPRVVKYANLIGAVLDIGLGVGVRGSRRAAWSFAVALGAVLVVINFIAAPYLLRAGTAGLVALGVAASRAGLFGLLTGEARAFAKG
jgi:hypothetical protein